MDKLTEPRARFIISIINYLIFLTAAFVIFTVATPLKFLLVPVTLAVYLYDAYFSYKLGFHHGSESNSFEDQVMNHDSPQALFGENDIVFHYDQTDNDDENNEDKKSS
jgi:hypothetical protein